MHNTIVKRETGISLPSMKRQLEKSGRFHLTQNGRVLRIMTMYNNKEFTCNLRKNENNALWDLRLSYSYETTGSYFTYAKPEHRLCRNKAVLSMFFRDLALAGVWKFIDPNFLKINENFGRATGKAKQAMFELLMSPERTRERKLKAKKLKTLMIKKNNAKLGDVTGLVGMGGPKK